MVVEVFRRSELSFTDVAGVNERIVGFPVVLPMNVQTMVPQLCRLFKTLSDK